MIEDSLGKELHQKMVSGEKLSKEEKLQLEAWYNHYDNIENEILNSTHAHSSTSKIKTQIDSVLSQLVELSLRLQNLISENENIQKENSQLKKQLSQLMSRKSA